MGWLEKQSEQRGSKLETLDGDERLVSGHLRLVLGKNAQPGPGHIEAASDAHLQGVQLDVTVESGAQRFKYSSLQNWVGARQYELNSDSQNRDRQQGRDSPAPYS
jgi:hypothetical protein